MLKISCRLLLFLMVTFVVGIIAARSLWAVLPIDPDEAEYFYRATELIGPYFGFQTDGNKTEMRNVILMIISWMAYPIGIAAGFAALWIYELTLSASSRRGK